MPAPDWFHPFDLTDIGNMRRVSLSARWVMVELFGGELGEKHGLVQVRAALIADECGMKVADVNKSIDELDAAGLIVYDRANRLAYHAGSLLRQGPDNPKHRLGWERQLGLMATGIAKDAALSELDGHAFATATGTTTATATVGIDRVSKGYQDSLLELSKSLEEQMIDMFNELKHANQPHCQSSAKGNLKHAKSALARDPMDVWRTRFQRAASSPFLSGQKTDFVATFIWLTGPENAIKVDSGQYDNRTAPVQNQPDNRLQGPKPQDLQAKLAAMGIK